MSVRWSLDQKRTHLLSSTDTILPDVFGGFWILNKSPDGLNCEVLYSIHVEPGGRIPVWLFAAASERYVFDVIGAVRSRLQ
jgi:hypothetical protein